MQQVRRWLADLWLTHTLVLVHTTQYVRTLTPPATAAAAAATTTDLVYLPLPPIAVLGSATINEQTTSSKRNAQRQASPQTYHHCVPHHRPIRAYNLSRSYYAYVVCSVYVRNKDIIPMPITAWLNR